MAVPPEALCVRIVEELRRVPLSLASWTERLLDASMPPRPSSRLTMRDFQEGWRVFCTPRNAGRSEGVQGMQNPPDDTACSWEAWEAKVEAVLAECQSYYRDLALETALDRLLLPWYYKKDELIVVYCASGERLIYQEGYEPWQR